MYSPGAQMLSDDGQDLLGLDITFTLGDFQEMHDVQDLKVEGIVLRLSIGIRDLSCGLSVYEFL